MYKLYIRRTFLISGLIVSFSLCAAQKQVKNVLEDVQQSAWGLTPFKRPSEEKVQMLLGQQGFSGEFCKGITQKTCVDGMTLAGVYLTALTTYKKTFSSENPFEPDSCVAEDFCSPLSKILRALCISDTDALKVFKQKGLVTNMIKLPEAQQILDRLTVYPDLSDFLENTSLATRLSNTEVQLEQLGKTFNEVGTSYIEKMGKINPVAQELADQLLRARSESVMRALLEDYPDVLDDFNKIQSGAE